MQPSCATTLGQRGPAQPRRWTEHHPLEGDVIVAVAALDEGIYREGRIDLLKIDTEHNEQSIVMAIPDNTMAKIDHVYCENKRQGAPSPIDIAGVTMHLRQTLAMNARPGRRGV